PRRRVTNPSSRRLRRFSFGAPASESRRLRRLSFGAPASESRRLRRLDSTPPEQRAADDARAVVDASDIGRQLAFEAPGVAAAYPQPVDLRQHAQQLDRAPDALLPLPVADALARAVAELLVERLALAERQVRDLEVRTQRAVAVQRGAESGSERDHHL